jgi:mono/diheme cytochrome c family protein
VTEVPEHLLRRAKERRAAVSGGGGDEPAATPGDAPGTATAASAVEPAAAAPAAAAPAVVEPPKPVSPSVAASLRRPRVPKFAIPVLVALPLWALIYAGTLTSSAPADPQLELGRSVYNNVCSGCHGATGGGGTGRNLHELLLTFPDAADHIAWVQNGSPAAGTPYGAADRPGGQRIAQSGGFSAMPGFADSLSEEEIAAVVRYERVEFGGEDPAAGAAAGGESSGSTEGH